MFSTTLLAGCVLSDTVTESRDSIPYSRRAYLAGRAEAQRDIQRGVLARELAGKPPTCFNEHERLLQLRYGIESRHVAGCVVNARIDGHMLGYNDVSEAEIFRRFGRQIFDHTYIEAQKLYKKKYPHGF